MTISKHIETLALTITKKGARIFLNNQSLTRCGFTDNAKYEVAYFQNKVLVTLSEVGNRSVCSGPKGDVIDLQNLSLSKSIPNSDRVQVTYKIGVLEITAHHHDEKVKKREVNFVERLKRQLPFRVSEFFSGTGALSREILKGLLLVGITSQTVFANDHCRHAIDLQANYTDSSGSVLVQDDLFEMDKSLIPESDIVILGYPCVGFSRQQSTKRKRDIEHEKAGMLFVPMLEAINRANPAIIVLENSDNMQGSETEFIFDTVLAATGYKSTSTTLTGIDHGEFERRKRLAKVYYSAGLGDLDIEQIKPSLSNIRKVSSLREEVPLDSKMWKDLSYLKSRNDDPSHSHKFIELSGDETRLPAFGANYAKIQNDSAFWQHPTNPDLNRIFTAGEHCSVRNIHGPLRDAIISIEDGTHHLQKGRTNATKAHMLLGNSISPQPWQVLGQFIGEWASKLPSNKESSAQVLPFDKHRQQALSLHQLLLA